MISSDYLDKGLTGFGRCKHAPWDAHFPAAVLAGFYLAANRRLPAETERNLEAQLRLLVATRPTLFAPYPAGRALADPFEPVTAALATSIDRFSELGHNCIFGAYVLRALKDHAGSGWNQGNNDRK